MRADYDREANAISIDLVDANRWDYSEEVQPRVNVAIVGGRPVNIELLYPDRGLRAPLRAAAERYALDGEALIAAAQAAMAAPDRVVTLDVAVRPAA